jgi:pSer/pThr/pTyr-binding forkhead associated (FHA) protein
MKCSNPTCNNIFSGPIPKFCEECGQLQPVNTDFPFASIGDKNVISNTSNTINNNTIQDDTKKIVICAVSGKRIFLKDSIRCVSCDKDVALEYYDFDINKCTNCFNINKQLYRKEVDNALKDQIIDPEERKYLNQKAKELSISVDLQLVIESEQKNKILIHQYGNELQGLHKIEFDIAKRELFSKFDLEGASIKFKSIYDKHITNESVANYYFFTNAIKNPSDYISQLQNSSIDIYWQHYWGFLALINVNDTENSFDKINRIKLLYNSKLNEINLAETLLYVRCFLKFKEIDYLTEAKLKIQEINTIENELLNQLYQGAKFILDNYNVEASKIISSLETNTNLSDFEFLNRYVFQIGTTNIIVSSDNKPTPSNDPLLGVHNLESIDRFKNISLLDASKLDTTPFITIGRELPDSISEKYYYHIDNIYLSRTHCKIRALTPFLFEIIDLGSTNGTIVNEVKLYPNVSYFFLINNKIRLGNSTTIDLKYVYEKLNLSLHDEKPINTNIIYSYTIDSGKILNLGILIKISKEYFELNTQLINKHQQFNKLNLVNFIFGYNDGLMFYYYRAINKGIEIIFINNQKFDYNKSIDPDITYEKMFHSLHICNKCRNFIDHQVIDKIECKQCNTKEK